MASKSKVSSALNSFFGGDFLNGADVDLLSTIEDYFCFEDQEEASNEEDGK